MGEKILSTALKNAGSILQTPGSVNAPQEIEFDLPIQPTFDMARIAMDGGAPSLDGSGGYMLFTWRNVHAVAGNIIEIFDIFNPASTAFGFVSQWWLDYLTQVDPPNAWMVDMWGAASASGLFVQATSGFSGPGIGGINRITAAIETGSGVLPRMTHRWNGFTSVTMFIGSFAFPLVSNGQSSAQVHLPMLMPPSGQVAGVGPFFQTEMSGAKELHINLLVWAGRAGAVPPGLL